MRNIIVLSIISFTFLLNGITVQSQNRYLIGTYHEENVNIYGLSFGAYSTIQSEQHTNTYGIRTEVPGLGFIAFLGGGNLGLKQDHISEKIYGISLSATGSFGSNIVYGININGIMSYTFKTSGLSICGFGSHTYKNTGVQISGTSNYSHILNGVQISLIENSSKNMNGVQFCLFGNSSENSKGVQLGLFNHGGNMKGMQIGLYNKSKASTFQIGLINKNGKRILPLINF